MTTEVIPKALFISICLVLLPYVLIDIAAVEARKFLPGALWDFFVIGGGIMACVTAVHAVMTISGRYAMKFAEDGFFPSFVKRINRRFGTPHWGLTIPFVLSVLTILFVQNIIVLGAMLNFGLLYMVSMVLMCAFQLPRTHPEIFTAPDNRFSPALVRSTALIATLLNVVFMALLRGRSSAPCEDPSL